MIKTIIAWLGIACVAIVGIGIATIFYQSLDESGRIHHDKTVDVYMDNNWLVGENRVCGLHFQYANGKPTDTMSGLVCSNGDEKSQSHNVTVTFKGNFTHEHDDGVSYPVADQWRCTRESDKFTCEPIVSDSK